LVGIAVTIGDEMTLTSVDVDMLVGDSLVHAVSNMIEIHNNKIDLILTKCLIK
jgi:hypothetical protein